MYKVIIIVKSLFPLFVAGFSLICNAQQYSAELIRQQTTIEIKNEKLIQTYSFHIQINNRNGDQYAEVAIPFNKMNKIFGIEAFILDNTGKKVQELKNNDITERSENSDMSFYSDSYVKEFALRNHTYPYTLIYSYRIESTQYLYLTNWSPVLDEKIPTFDASLQLDIPLGYKMKYHSNLVDMPKVDTLQDGLRYTWTSSYKNPITSENFSPSSKQYLPYIVIVPEKFKYENEGSHENWVTYGNWNLSLFNGLDDLPLTEKIKIHSLTDTISVEKEKIRILFHYLQDATRYIFISIKTGGMKPFPASYVAEKKYGDCKALANYFKSCLSEIGINAFYTKINAGNENEPIDTAFPSQQFNHVILFIPLKTDSLWVDCTSDLAFGYLGPFTQNRPALVVSKNASSLVMTPKLTSSDVLERRKIKVTINPSGNVQAIFSCSYKGNRYELLAALKAQLSETERRKYIENSIIDDGFQLDTYTISNADRDNPEIAFEYTAVSDLMLKEYGNESLLKIIPLGFPYLTDPNKRKLPVQINYPISRSDSSEIIIPENYAITAIPQNIAYHTKFGDYKVNFVQKGNSIIVTKQMNIHSGEYPLTEYSDFYAYILKILESENSYYITIVKS